MPADSPHMPADVSVYEVLVGGFLSRRWTDWLDHAQITPMEDTMGTPATRLVIGVADQAALLGQLQKLHNLGLQLLSVRLSRLPARSGENDDAAR